MSSTVTVHRVVTRAQRDAFLTLPWRIYAHDPVWVPPLLLERRQFIDPRQQPFYRHGVATLLLAEQNGEAVGRMLVSDDPRYNEAHGSNVGCFGMFESIDDPRVAHALLDAGAEWLRARGRNEIMGPIDLSTNNPAGLLIDGFDTPPRLMMNHNPPYYRGLLESWGLSKAKDLYAFWFEDSTDLAGRWHARAERLRKRLGLTIRPMRRSDESADVLRCKAIYNSAWEHNWGFVQMTDAEFKHLADQLHQLTSPEFILLAEIGDRAVGMSVLVPDMNEAIRPLNGRLFNWGLPIGLWKFKRNLQRVKHCRLLVLGVLAEYRRRGIAELLILETLRVGNEIGHFVGAELGWTLEDNDAVNHAIEAAGARRYKTYRIFAKPI
ncbi:MAG: N-acetyltransferase [Planctomycetes bacterium]|nr:N-acetyltransferase [Planctomycetota bacterium]